jgi:hypothetical protein
MSQIDESHSSPSRLVSDLPPEELQVLKAVREVQFGVIEVVVHERRITEIRQTRKTRIGNSKSVNF